jgi:hypothetical protein
MPKTNSKPQAETSSSGKRESRRNSFLTKPENLFHCSWEWHFGEMTSRLAPLLYSWGRRLSVNSDCFYPSVKNIASHFTRDRTTVLNALHELVEEGWAEVINREAGKTVTYRFIDHEEWARTHPKYSCTEKDVMPWEGQGDPLAKQLHAVSGGLAKFMSGQMMGLRKSGLSDEQITSEFRIFLDRNPHSGYKWKRVYYGFHPYLHRLSSALRKAVDATNSSSGVSRPRDTHQSHTSDTTSRTGATPTSRVHATQVFEVDFRKSGAKLGTIPTPSSKERQLAASTNDQGRGFPPSKPSPITKAPVARRIQ